MEISEYWFDLFLWVMGIIGALIVILLGIIAYFIKMDKETVKGQLSKHEDWIINLQEQVAENQKQTSLAIQALQINQQNDRERFEMFNERFADDIVAKIRGITPQ